VLDLAQGVQSRYLMSGGCHGTLRFFFTRFYMALNSYLKALKSLSKSYVVFDMVSACIES
jgi:hypothetical protein